MPDTSLMGVKASVLEEREQTWLDSHPTVARCMFCPDWAVEGSALETREKGVQHRTEAHPETFRLTRVKRPVRKTLRRWSSRNLTREREQELHEERRKRLRLYGLPPDE